MRPEPAELTGKKTPRTGLEGKFSVYHAAACALLRGDGTPTAFTDEVVNLPELIALRDKVTATTDADCHEAAVAITLHFQDGTTTEKHVARAIGSIERPRTREQLEEKFLDQAKLAIYEDASARLLTMARRLPEMGDLSEATVPERAGAAA
jgi:2-methylcitrate dehydratase PrpD